MKKIYLIYFDNGLEYEDHARDNICACLSKIKALAICEKFNEKLSHLIKLSSEINNKYRLPTYPGSNTDSRAVDKFYQKLNKINKVRRSALEKILRKYSLPKELIYTNFTLYNNPYLGYHELQLC